VNILLQQFHFSAANPKKFLVKIYFFPCEINFCFSEASPEKDHENFPFGPLVPICCFLFGIWRFVSGLIELQETCTRPFADRQGRQQDGERTAGFCFSCKQKSKEEDQ
jgi:hypothetical protein